MYYINLGANFTLHYFSTTKQSIYLIRGNRKIGAKKYGKWYFFRIFA